MSVEWAQPYEAPISLDAPKMFGTAPARPTYWTTLAIVPTVIVGAVVLLGNYFWWHNPWASYIWLLPLLSLWLTFCWIMRNHIGQRPPEHWFKMWLRHVRTPKDAVPVLADVPRGCVLVDTTNLRGLDEGTLHSNVKKLHNFYVGLPFPVQVIVRCWPQPGGWILRKWYVAFTAPEKDLLHGREQDIIEALRRAGLHGSALNGNLYDELNKCWTPKPRDDRTGPSNLQRFIRYSRIDGEYVRGLLLDKIPRAVESNWLVEVLDGDLPVDVGMWLEPLDSVDMQDELRDRINNWETTQYLNVGSYGSNGKLGYRDPGIDDQIKDATRTKLLLNRRQLRVFRCAIGFVIRGNSLEEVKRIETRLINQLREHAGADALLPTDFEQDKAPLMVVPTGMPALPYTMEVVTPFLARTGTFSASSLVMPGGVRCGLSQGSTHENTLNVWSLMNPHMVVLATSGAGKGYWLKVFLWRLLHMLQSHRVWIIQAEKDEYSIMAEAMPDGRGKVIRFTSLDELEPRRPAGKRVYGIHEVDDRTYAHRATDWLAGAQLTVYDLTRMPATDRGKAVAFLLEALEHSASRNGYPQHGHVVIDELGIVLHDKVAALAIETAWRRFRSIPKWDNPAHISRRGMIGLSQRASDLLAPAAGQTAKVIADLSPTKVYLRMESTELDGIEKKLSLTQADREYLENGEEGDALLVAGRARIALRMNADAVEDSIART